MPDQIFSDDQNFGLSFAKILVTHLPKFWSFICQNFSNSFAKKLTTKFLVYTDKLDKDYEQKYKLDQSI